MQGAIFSLKRPLIRGICELITPITLKNWPLGGLLGCKLGMPEGSLYINNKCKGVFSSAKSIVGVSITDTLGPTTSKIKLQNGQENNNTLYYICTTLCMCQASMNTCVHSTFHLWDSKNLPKRYDCGMLF